MKVKYLTDTDTLYIQLSDRPAAQTTELNENVLLDLDHDGRVVSLTVEHAAQHSGKMDFLLRSHARLDPLSLPGGGQG